MSKKSSQTSIACVKKSGQIQPHLKQFMLG